MMIFILYHIFGDIECLQNCTHIRKVLLTQFIRKYHVGLIEIALLIRSGIPSDWIRVTIDTLNWLPLMLPTHLIIYLIHPVLHNSLSEASQRRHFCNTILVLGVDGMRCDLLSIYCLGVDASSLKSLYYSHASSYDLYL